MIKLDNTQTAKFLKNSAVLYYRFRVFAVYVVSINISFSPSCKVMRLSPNAKIAGTGVESTTRAEIPPVFTLNAHEHFTAWNTAFVLVFISFPLIAFSAFG
jgi:hypothetical protein